MQMVITKLLQEQVEQVEQVDKLSRLLEEAQDTIKAKEEIPDAAILDQVIIILDNYGIQVDEMKKQAEMNNIMMETCVADKKNWANETEKNQEMKSIYEEHIKSLNAKLQDMQNLILEAEQFMRWIVVVLFFAASTFSSKKLRK